jgi:hypothetical protein
VVAGNGSAELRAIAARCKVVGNRGLLNASRATLRVEAKPLVAAAQQAARTRLPRGGGLNEQVAAQKWSVSALAGARSAGVRLKTVAPDTLQTDDGYVSHPTFGRRGPGQWKRQELPPAAKGWATDTVNAYGPPLAAAMLKTLDKVAAEITAGL